VTRDHDVARPTGQRAAGKVARRETKSARIDSLHEEDGESQTPDLDTAEQGRPATLRSSFFEPAALEELEEPRLNLVEGDEPESRHSGDQEEALGDLDGPPGSASPS
jgi:hypothetical protein